MPSRIYNRDNRNYILAKRNAVKRKIVNPKYYPTKTLKAFIDNDFIGIDGLDREQYSQEINDLYFERTDKEMERSIQKLIDHLEKHDEEIPPLFNFTWCPVTETYLEWSL